VSNATWPADWTERKAGVDCLLCAEIGDQSDSDHGIFVAELASTAVRLARRSRLPGYCIVSWRHGHVAEPTELDPQAAGAYWADVLAVSRAIQNEFNPVKMNLLTLGNWVPHLHTHVVPRYHGDPSPGGPITWADMFNDEPDDAQVEHARATRLRTLLAIGPS
jgi:diadenosine tetraphosphate (Ap4A) HIT family hydrolase